MTNFVSVTAIPRQQTKKNHTPLFSQGNEGKINSSA